MRVDQVRYFVMATLGLSGGSVVYNNMHDTPNALVTVYDDAPEKVIVHNTIMIAQYQAIIRIAEDTADTVGEARARTLLDRVRSLHNRETYDGCYLTASMSAVTNPITFTPDNGSGTTKASTFTVNDYILIGSEILKVTVASTTITAARAQLGTTIAAHSDNDEVKNITQNPIPGELCDSATASDGVFNLGLDEKGRRMWSVNWKVTLKP